MSNGLYSDPFPCTIGVRQVENLSPFLFALDLNVLENFMHNNNVKDLPFISTKFENELGMYMYLKLLVLLYADDTILLSETHLDLQYHLKVFEDYCKSWNLNINTNKTKIVSNFWKKDYKYRRSLYFRW
jgi:hypothetical protein